MDFYIVAAQVIPVLFLAAMVEDQFFTQQPASYDSGADPADPSRWNGFQPIFRIWWLLMLVAGEVCALLALDDSQVRHSNLVGATVWLALVVGLLAAVGPVIERQVGFLRQHLGTRAASRGLLLFFFVMLTVFTWQSLILGMWLIR